MVSVCSRQVRWEDQSQYHQESESVFVGGRLSFLLPPPVEKEAVRESSWFRRVAHTQLADYRRKESEVEHSFSPSKPE